jgi:enoyl-CoA hydratase/carnithine racemase
VHAADELMPRALELADKMAGLDEGIVRAYLSTLRDGFGLSLHDALELERSRAVRQYAGLGQCGISGRAASFHSKL